MLTQDVSQCNRLPKLRPFPALLLLILFFLLQACSTPPTGDAENGRRWYALYRCDACHGEQGRGGRGPGLAGLTLRYSAFLGKIRHSGSNIMPSFPEKQLSNQDAADIYIFLKLQPPPRE